jgi:hypothetical protein
VVSKNTRVYEQGISAKVTGKYLDNAFKSNNKFIRFIGTMPTDDKVEYFNLATLIALARKAVI